MKRDVGNAGVEGNRSGEAHDRIERRGIVQKATDKLQSPPPSSLKTRKMKKDPSSFIPFPFLPVGGERAGRYRGRFHEAVAPY